MDGVFYSASSTTEFHFAQESKRASSETNYLIPPHGSTHKRSTQQSLEPSSKPPSQSSTSYSRFSIENNQPNLSLNPPNRYTFLSGLEKLKTPVCHNDKENLNGVTIQIPDEERNSMNTNTYYNDFRPLIATQRNLTNRSKTPISLHSQRSVTVRGEGSHIPLNLIFPRDIELNGQRNVSEQSPVTARKCNSNSERVFQVKTGKIVEKSVENRPSSSLKRTSYSNRTSTMGWSRSKSGESPQRSSCMTPSRLSRIDSLKKIKLGESPSASSGAKLGISLVRETLDDAIDEKESWKARVEELKQSVKQEKACVEKAQENIRYMLGYLGRVTKRSEILDKSAMNTQVQVNRLHEEVEFLQKEVYSYVEKIRQINGQIEAEVQVLKRNKQLTITLKSLISEQMKERDAMKTNIQASKHTRNKSLDRYRNAAQTHRNFVTVVEDQFQKFTT